MMATFFDSPNSIIFVGLTFGFLSMTIGTIVACILKLKCFKCEICGCEIDRDISAEIMEREIEARMRRERPDDIPPSSQV
jgi:hypothetical protein